MARSKSWLKCTVPDCENVAICRGWCDKHYTRYKRHGDPNYVTRLNSRGLSLEDKLRLPGWDIDENGCWNWKGRHPSKRYGMVSLNHKDFLAHRIAYQVWVGPIPNGLLICHKCDNMGCINPEHLYAGTNQDNMNDMKNHGRQANQDGENGPRAKVTEDQVREIRTRYKNGETQSSIAEKFGLTQSGVSVICRRKAWKFVY